MIAIASGKGGTGKTTVTVGLTAAIGKQRGRAVAVDADVEMPNLHAMAGVDRTATNESSHDAYPIPGATGASILPAPTNEQGITRYLHDIGGRDVVTLVDCPAGAGRTAVEPMRVADVVLLVTTLDRAALRDTLKTAAMARTVGTPLLGVVVNRADRSPTRIESYFDTPLRGTIPTLEQPDPTSPRFTRFLGRTAESVRRLYDTLKTPD